MVMGLEPSKPSIFTLSKVREGVAPSGMSVMPNSRVRPMRIGETRERLRSFSPRTSRMTQFFIVML